MKKKIKMVLKKIKIILKIYKLYLKLRRMPDGDKLNIGCGSNQIKGNGWINLDLEPSKNIYYYNAENPLPFKSNSIKFIFTEHMIEHLDFKTADIFLKECFRVMQSGGVIRIATPDLEIIPKLINNDTQDAIEYTEKIKLLFSVDSNIDVINLLFYGHGHKYIYNQKKLMQILIKHGFSCVERKQLQCSSYSELTNLEEHGKVVGNSINQFESLVIEAIKL